MSELLLLEDIRAQKHQLSALFSVDGYRFSTTYWFDTADLNALEARFGREQMQNIYFHIAAFEINRLCSLRPKAVDWGAYSRFAGEDFRSTWSAIFRKVWAQWRFENDDPEYFGPEMKGQAYPTPPPPGGGISTLRKSWPSSAAARTAWLPPSSWRPLGSRMIH